MKKRKSKPSSRGSIAAILAAIFIICVCFVPAKVFLPQSITDKLIVSNSLPFSTANMSIAEAAARKLLFDAGWSTGQYKVTIAKNAAANTSEEAQSISAVPVGGQGAYSQTGIFTIQDMVDWLGSEDPAAKKIVAEFEKNGVTRDQVLDVNSWVIVTSGVAYHYRDNTAYRNGKIINVGDRDGKAGEKFFMFILPDKSGIPVRAACGNPQNNTPTPDKPGETTTKNYTQPTTIPSTTQPIVTTTQPVATTTQPVVTTTQPVVTTTQPVVTTTQPVVTTTQPVVTTTQPVVTTTQPVVTTTKPAETTTLTPKSNDPTDYKHPGDGDGETDTGTGIKPVVPIVTTPADKNPPVVEVIVTWISGIIDTVTNKPGSETGGSAPGVEPTVGEATTRYIPPVETGANPTQGPTVPGETTTQPVNSGDPGLGDF